MASVRYANVGGSNVRNAAAGSFIVLLNQGDLMYDIDGVAPISAPLNGTMYTWIKVNYYKIEDDNFSKSGVGWVATSTVTAASTTAPSKSAVISSNTLLKQNQILINARYIYKELLGKGWTKNAICAMLGNMELESTINPGRWQNGTVNTANGFGLVQWTPSTDYTNWLPSGADKGDIDNQLGRITHEVTNGLQWQKWRHTPEMTFIDFTKSTKTVSVLAEYFLLCYERPDVKDEAVKRVRRSAAVKWDTLLGILP